jgi:ubiquinone/menaquinone biosynthesis C-methylase UbiE
MNSETKMKNPKYEDFMVKNVYNEIGQHFDVTRAYTWDWITQFTNHYSNHDVVLDIGCGSGRNLREQSNWVGIDNSETFVEICRKKNLNVLQADMTNLPIEDNSVDGIICIASFHHLCNEERRMKALREMYRILKQNCKVLISVWSIHQPKKTRRTFKYGDNIVPWNKYGIIYERYYYIFKKEEIEELFMKCAFKIESHKWDCGNEIYILKK